MYLRLRFYTHRQMMLCVAPFVVAMQIFIGLAILGNPDPGSVGTAIIATCFGWLLIGNFVTNLLIRRGITTVIGVPIAIARTAVERRVGRILALAILCASIPVYLVIRHFIHSGGPAYVDPIIATLVTVPAMLTFGFDLLLMVWLLTGFRFCP